MLYSRLSTTQPTLHSGFQMFQDISVRVACENIDKLLRADLYLLAEQHMASSLLYLLQGRLLQGRLSQGSLLQGNLSQGSLLQGKFLQGRLLQGMSWFQLVFAGTIISTCPAALPCAGNLQQPQGTSMLHPLGIIYLVWLAFLLQLPKLAV